MPRRFNLSDNTYHEFASASHFWIRARFEVIRNLLRFFSAGKTPVEIGCGRASTTVLLQKHLGTAITCVDIDIAALNEIESVKQRCFYDISEHHAPWERKFSSIFLLDVLEHVSEPVDFLRDCGWHLADKGIIIINVPALPFLYSKYDEIQGHRVRYTKKTLEADLEAAGFTVCDSVYWGFFMVPVLLLRKLLARITADSSVIKSGFKPPLEIISRIFSFLYAVERYFQRFAPIGTSVLAIAVKNNFENSAKGVSS